MSRSYRPTIPVTYIAQVLGFPNVLTATEGSEEKETDGLEECVEWLKAHGACLITDTNGEMQLDSKVCFSLSLISMEISHVPPSHFDRAFFFLFNF